MSEDSDENSGKIYYVAVREKNEEWFMGEDVPHDFICPICGRDDEGNKNGEFIQLDDELCARQFYTDKKTFYSGNMKFAPYGICIDMCTYIGNDEDPYYTSQGTPLVIDSENFDLSSLPEINRKYWENKLELDGIIEDSEIFESSTATEGERYHRVKSYFSSAFTSGPLMLDPPYTVPAIGSQQGSGGQTLDLLLKQKYLEKKKEREDNEAGIEGYQLSADDKKISSDDRTEVKDKMHWFRQLSPILSQFKAAAFLSKGLAEDRDLNSKKEYLEIFIERKNSLFPETEEWEDANSKIDELIEEIETIEKSLAKVGKMPKRRVEVLVAGYLHKTVKLQNIEPFWVFMKRTNMNKRTIENSMSNWYPPEQVNEMMKLVAGLKNVRPSEKTIGNLILMIDSFCNDVVLSLEESNLLEKEAINVMNIFNNSLEEGDESEFTRTFNAGYFVKEQFNFASEGVAHSPGYVEALCVMESARRKLAEEKAIDLQNYLFPPPQLNKSWWMTALSDDAIETFEYFEGIISELEK